MHDRAENRTNSNVSGENGRDFAQTECNFTTNETQLCKTNAIWKKYIKESKKVPVIFKGRCFLVVSGFCNNFEPGGHKEHCKAKLKDKCECIQVYNCWHFRKAQTQLKSVITCGDVYSCARAPVYVIAWFLARTDFFWRAVFYEYHLFFEYCSFFEDDSESCNAIRSLFGDSFLMHFFCTTWEYKLFIVI